MKTIFIFAAGSFVPGILNQIITHPAIVDVALGCLLGVLFGLLVAMLFVGPTPAPKPKNVTPRVKTQRKPKAVSIIAKATDYELFPKSVANMPVVNYEWSAA